MKNTDIKGPNISLFGLSLAVRYREIDVDVWECRLHQRNGLHIVKDHCGYGEGGSRERSFADAKENLFESLRAKEKGAAP